jgi:hypothetical protein
MLANASSKLLLACLLAVARQRAVNNNEVVFSLESVLRLYKGGRGPESDGSSEGTRLARDGHQPARKRRKSAVICFQNGSKKAEVNPNCKGMKLLRAGPHK